MKFLFSIFVGLFLSISAHGQLSFTTYCDIDNGNLKVGGVLMRTWLLASWMLWQLLL